MNGNDEHHHSPRARRVVQLMPAIALAASGVVLGLGIPPAVAFPYTVDDSVATPGIQSVRLEGSDAHVTFTDRSDNEIGFAVEVRNRDSLQEIYAVVEVPSAPGTGRAVTQVVGGIPPGPVCADVVAIGGKSPDGVYTVSNQSNMACADSAKPPTDLALQNIRGKGEQQWTTVSGQSPAYLVEMRNTGPEATDIAVDIATSGVVTLADQAAGQAGWTAAGFTCTTRPPSGGENAALRCTGGRLKQGDQTNPAVIVRFTGPGFGTIHASISVGGDTNTANNGTAFSVRVL